MPTPFEDFDLLTLPEVAKFLHCSKAHVGKVIEGRVKGCEAIPCIRLGRRKLVRRESLADWIQHNEHRGKIAASPEWDVRKRA